MYCRNIKPFTTILRKCLGTFSPMNLENLRNLEVREMRRYDCSMKRVPSRRNFAKSHVFSNIRILN